MQEQWGSSLSESDWPALIATDDGTLVEKGAAVRASVNTNEWLYTATTAAPAASVKIVVDVADLAGQVTDQVRRLSPIARPAALVLGQTGFPRRCDIKKLHHNGRGGNLADRNAKVPRCLVRHRANFPC